MEPINNVKGTHDIFLDEHNAYEMVESMMKSIAELYGYNGVRPPVLEYSQVFSRGVGESSDIVRKEMYTFPDKGGRDLTLRPEFTAGIMRLVIQNKLYATNELPLKLYYNGPVFRYERPQLGRYRQFNQFGVESIGNNSPINDVEVIVLAYTILCSLGLEGVTLKINTLGDDASRDNYRKALKEYFAAHIENMCEDCKSRYELNPLRILDCKVPEDRPIIDKAPKIGDYLSEQSKLRFEDVKDALDTLQIKYEVDDGLVRGLDYYSETVFEFHYKSKTGANYGAIGHGINIMPGTQKLLVNLTRTDRNKPAILASATRATGFEQTASSFSYTARGPIRIIATSRVLLPSRPVSVLINGEETIEESRWDESSGTYFLTFDSSPDGVRVEFKW